MHEQEQSRLIYHGMMVFVLGLAIGIPFAIVFASSGDAHTHLWSVAHLEALTHGLLLLVLGGGGKFIVLPERHCRLAVTLVVSGAYSSISGATVGAIWDVLGLKPGQNAANTVAWLLLGYGTVSVCAAVVWLAMGARREYRQSMAATAGATALVTVPQFGGQPTAEVLVDTVEWHNFGRTQSAHPIRVVSPESAEDLRAAVREAVADGYRVKAVGAAYSWSAAAVTDGVMIDMSNLNRVLEVNAARPGSDATITVEAGTTVHQLTTEAARHGLTFRTTTVIPWVQVGGAVANGCHGSGRDVATFSDQVCAMQVVGPDGSLTRYERDDSDTWLALLVNLGALGIVYSLTFDCVPAHRVRATDEIVSAATIDASMAQWYRNNEALEIFWFPFNDRALVKTWNSTDAPATETLPRRALDDLVMALEQDLAPLLRRILLDEPEATPELCRLMFDMMPKLDVVCPAEWAMQYQTSFAPVVDTSYAIPIDDDLRSARSAWAFGVDLVDRWAREHRYPQNMVLHARFVGRPSGALLSPTEGHEHGSCLIETLTFEGTPGYEEFFTELGVAWQALGGRPHWAKLVFAPTDYRALYGDRLDRWAAVRARLDPDGVFINDFVSTVLRDAR